MPRTALKNLSDVPPATPGILTTEFWKTLGFTIISLLVATGIITPVNAVKYKPFVVGVALLAPAIALSFYSLSRGKTKAAAIEATANVVMQDKHLQLQREVSGLPMTPASPFEQVGGEA